MKKEEAVQGFRALMQEINHLTCMEEEMMWDTRVNLPPRGAEYRSELMGYLSGQKYKLKTSPRMWEYLQELSQYTFDDVILNRMQEVARRDYDRLTKIPADLEARYAKHGIMTELIWQDARQNNDYESVKGVLKNSFEFKREYARCFGCDSVMDYLLDNWEQGCTTAQVDGIFSDIKGYVLPLLDKIRASGKPYSRQKLQGFYPREQQLALIHDVTALVGYNHEAGRIGESAHPFTLRICPRDDMRFTVTIHETDFTNALISSLHEGGHALYGANLGATESWLLARSLRTLPLRVKKMAENGLALAKFFESHPKVEKVYYPGLESSPSKALADKQFEGNGYGGMLCVNFKGGQKEIDKLISNLQLVRFVPTLAGVGTTLTYPPRASHRDLSPDELAAIGITMGQIRLSSGLEDTDDLLNDFDQALAKM